MIEAFNVQTQTASLNIEIELPSYVRMPRLYSLIIQFRAYKVANVKL